MPFAQINNILAADLPYTEPGFRITSVVLSADRFAIDATDGFGTPNAVRLEVGILGQFTAQGTLARFSEIRGIFGSVLDAETGVVESSLKVTFRGGVRIDGGTYDFSDLSAAFNVPLYREVFPDDVRGLQVRLTDGDDFYVGTAYADVFRLFGGDDAVDTGAGNDRIFAGQGDDTIQSNLGRDTIYLGAGDDAVAAEGGNDTAYGGRGKDVLLMGRGQDTAYGGNGADYLDGSNGDDILYGDTGSDVLIAGNGGDRLYGGNGHDGLIAGGRSGIDYLDGGAGRDVLISGGEVTFMTGGADADVFVFTSNGAQQVVVEDFEQGVDKIALSATQMTTLEAILADPDSVLINDLPDNPVADAPDVIRPQVLVPTLEIQLGNDTLYLKGVTSAELTRDDFVFDDISRIRNTLDDSPWDISEDQFML